jgi:hypothetical protein
VISYFLTISRLFGNHNRRHFGGNSTSSWKLYDLHHNVILAIDLMHFFRFFPDDSYPFTAIFKKFGDQLQAINLISIAFC